MRVRGEGFSRIAFVQQDEQLMQCLVQLTRFEFELARGGSFELRANQPIDEVIEKERELRPRLQSEKLLFLVHLCFVQDTRRETNRHR